MLGVASAWKAQEARLPLRAWPMCGVWLYQIAWRYKCICSGPSVKNVICHPSVVDRNPFQSGCGLLNPPVGEVKALSSRDREGDGSLGPTFDAAEIEREPETGRRRVVDQRRRATEERLSKRQWGFSGDCTCGLSGMDGCASVFCH